MNSRNFQRRDRAEARVPDLPKLQGAGQPGRQPGGLIGQIDGLSGEIMQLARARQRFGEEESVYRQDALERQGEAAIGLGGEAGKWYNALGMKLAGEIKNPMLREHFVRYASGRAQAGYDRLMRHEVGQTEALKQLAVPQAPALAAYNAARTHARDQADGLSRELGGFWDATGGAPLLIGYTVRIAVK